MTAPSSQLATIAPTRTLVLCDPLPLRLSVWAAFAAILRYALDQTAEPNTTRAVHEYRKSIRRARALLRVARPSLDKQTWRELDAILRDQVRRTSALRDTDVLSETLNRLPKALQEAHAEAFITAYERLTGATQARGADDVHALLASTQPALLLAVSLLGVELPRGFDVEALDQGLREAYRAAAKALDQARDSRRADDVHTLRKRVKELRYQLEAVSAQHEDWTAEAERARFASLAEALGQITDLHVLEAAIKALDPALPAQQAFIDALTAHTYALTDAAFVQAQAALEQHAHRWVKSLRSPPKAAQGDMAQDG
jgi:CHAD domain-containing protein